MLALALVVLCGRVVWVQAGWGRQLRQRARRQQRRFITLPARPGNVLARSRGGSVLLAGSRQVPCVYADPALLGEERFVEASQKVGRALGLPPAEIYAKLYARRFTRFVQLARGITAEQVRAIRELGISAVRVSHEWRREYPFGKLAAHVVGYRRPDGVGAAGIEAGADSWLRARPGLKVVLCDASRRGRFARVLKYRPPADGRHVALSLDVVIQGFLEQALEQAARDFDAEAAMGVVMDPHSGDVLAMASVPTYEPARYSKAEAASRRNRAITDPYEPGSAFKPFIAIGAVQMQKATLRTTFFCHYGLYHAVRGGTIRDFPGEHFGTIPLSEIVIHSSNIGMAKLGERLGNANLYRIAWAFGFGARTGIDLPGESPGRLVPVRHWTSYATRRVPFGQGPIMVTVLQLANAFSAIANGGVLMRPRLVLKVIDARGSVVLRRRPRAIRRVLSPAVCRQFIDEVLVNVVERGTGRRCRLDKWQVFGKTGTAQQGGPGGYREREYTATFVAGAPASRPAVVCAVSVYRPDYAKGHTGGRVAAPVVREVLRRTLAYLDVPPDKFVTVAGVAPAGW